MCTVEPSLMHLSKCSDYRNSDSLSLLCMEYMDMQFNPMLHFWSTCIKELAYHLLAFMYHVSIRGCLSKIHGPPSQKADIDGFHMHDS